MTHDFSDHYGIFEIARVIEGRRTDRTCDEHKKLGLALYGRRQWARRSCSSR